VSHVCRCAQDGSLGRLRAVAEKRGWPYTDFGLPRDFVQENLPAGGRLIVLRADGHPSAVIHGVIHDTFDSSEGGRASIVGYWTLPDPPDPPESWR
jgi:hypothetical protein